MKYTRIAHSQLTLIMALIEYYRHQFHQQKKQPCYTKSKFTISKSGFRICSIEKYNKLCTGQMTDDYMIYHELLSNLGMVYHYDAKAAAQLHRLNQLIFFAAEEQIQSKLLDYAKKAATICSRHHNSIYYHEMYALYQIIIQYYQNHQFDEANYTLFIHIRKQIDQQLYPILLDAACYYYSRINYQHQLYFELLHDAEYYKGTSILIQLLKCAEQIRKDQHLTAIEILTTLEKQFSIDPSYYLLPKILSMLSISYHYYDNYKAIDYCMKTIEILTLQNRDSQLASPYHNLGVNYLDLKEYSSSAKAFLRAIQYDKQKAIIDLVYLYECYIKCPHAIAKETFLLVLDFADTIKPQVSELFALTHRFYQFVFLETDSKILDQIIYSFYTYRQEVKTNPLYFSLFFKHLQECCHQYKKEMAFYRLINHLK